MYKFILTDGTEIIGSIDKEADSYYLVDEDSAFGDIVVIEKTDIVKKIKVAR